MDREKIRGALNRLADIMLARSESISMKRVDEEVDTALAAIEAELPRWIPCSERLPEDVPNKDIYLVEDANGERYFSTWSQMFMGGWGFLAQNGGWIPREMAVRYCPSPELPKGEE